MSAYLVRDSNISVKSFSETTTARSCGCTNIAHISRHVIKPELLSHEKVDTDRQKSTDTSSIITNLGKR